MNLSTTYLGLSLPHPFMAGASPMVDDLDTVRRLEDAGTAAVVMHSLFEEQIAREEFGSLRRREHEESFAEALSFWPAPSEFALGPDQYLEQIRRIKDTVAVPVIASLNGTTDGGWTWYARLIEKAGADPSESSTAIEARLLSLVRAARRAVSIPIAVKLSPFFTGLSHLAHRLDEAGANGLVLFNRFYQPDLDVEALEVVPSLHLSDSSELLLRLRWLAIVSGRIRPSLAISGGVHTPLDAVKSILVGADAVQMVSALLRHGPRHLTTIRAAVSEWLEEHEYESLAQAKGSLALTKCPDPKAFERANYVRVLQSYRPAPVPATT
jgi:dihydroorotate dehydrogenase (fumarate)